MKYGSVCSGIEAASVAWHPLGWRAAFFSEIEAFPRAVLTERWSGVPICGDFTTIGEGDHEPIELLVGGTPCQDFSVAGLRAGLAGDRGGLTIEFVHLARRLRPRWLVWENVPGILSIDDGRAFGAFLALLGQCGYGFAYRILNAQHFGVPQRRRRVFVVGYLGDWRVAAAVLFEPESLRGDPAPRHEAGERIAAGLSRGAERDGDKGYAGRRREDDDNLIAFDGNRQAGALDVATAVNAHGGPHGRLDFETETFVVPPLMARSSRGGSQPLSPGFGTDGHIVTHSLRADVFDASEDGTGRGTPIIPLQCAEQLGREKRQNGMGLGNDGDPMFTLETRQPHGIGVGMTVRRLTPRECERLQGFPDDYTAITYRGKPASDGPRYRALGNSMAVPCMRWIGERIDHVADLMRANGSLAGERAA